MIVLKLSQDLEEIINKWKKITSYLLLLFKCYLFFCVWKGLYFNRLANSLSKVCFCPHLFQRDVTDKHRGHTSPKR